MRIVRRHRHGDVEAYELGYSHLGQPFMTVRFYRVGDLLIDSGQSRMQPEVVGLATERPFSRLLLTHHHEDHSGNAAAIQGATGAPVLGHPLCAEKLRGGFRILPYQELVWGRAAPLEVAPLPEVVEGEGVRLEPIHTPGHSKDLTIFLDRERGLLFSGDLYLADRIKYFRADERIADQIRSLRRAATLDFEGLLCAHRPVETGGPERLRRKLGFLEELVGEIARLHARGLGAHAIRRALPQDEVWGTVAFTLGNVGFIHLVRSTLAAIEAGELEGDRVRDAL
ncbi:MAG: MBL fold metallo-hydrolase [Deltaproteobacteria bacterium]|nr:MBL fold metallo-hydrolase [Deltaproteobacteria bacterium]